MYKDPETRFETAEDMVKFVVSNTYWASERWTLKDWKSTEYVNPVDGAAWQAGFNERWETVGGLGEMDWDTRQAARQALLEQFPAPEQHTVKRWYLEQSAGDRYSHRRNIQLSDALGEQLVEVWTTKPSRYSSFIVTASGVSGLRVMDRVGRMTISGMLKRLGQGDLKDEIAEAKTAEEARIAKIHRNNVRSEARQLAAKLIQLMEQHPDVKLPTTLTKLAALVNEE